MKKMLIITEIILVVFFIGIIGNQDEASGIEIHGVISQGYLQTTENNFIKDSEDGSFAFNEAAINFSDELIDRLRVGIQFFARNFGEMGGNKFKIDWAFADYRLNDWLGIRCGQVKAPHGFYNEYRDIDSLRNPIFLPQSVYQEVTRDVNLSIQGGGFYGSLDTSYLGELSYQILYGTQNVDKNNRLAEAMAAYPNSYLEHEDSEINVKYAGSLVWNTPVDGLRLGVSYDNIKMDMNGHWNKDIAYNGYTFYEKGDPVTLTFDKYENWVYSAEFILYDLSLAAEYIKTNKEFTMSILEEKGDHQPEGWYVAGAYRFADWFELGAYYSKTNASLASITAILSLPDYYSELEDICMTMRFDFNQYWTLKLEAHSLTGAYGLSVYDNPSSNPDDLLTVDFFEKEWMMYAAKLTLAF